MRTVLVWSLLALVPFTNLRMICFDHTGSGGVVRADTPECAEICKRDQAPPPSDVDSEAGCVLVAGGCASVSTLLLTLCTPATVFNLPLTSIAVAAPSRGLYSSPPLELFSPPPQL